MLIRNVNTAKFCKNKNYLRLAKRNCYLYYFFQIATCIHNRYTNIHNWLSEYPRVAKKSEMFICTEKYTDSLTTSQSTRGEERSQPVTPAVAPNSISYPHQERRKHPQRDWPKKATKATTTRCQFEAAESTSLGHICGKKIFWSQEDCLLLVFLPIENIEEELRKGKGLSAEAIYFAYPLNVYIYTKPTDRVKGFIRIPFLHT